MNIDNLPYSLIKMGAYGSDALRKLIFETMNILKNFINEVDIEKKKSIGKKVEEVIDYLYIQAMHEIDEYHGVLDFKKIS